MHKRTVQPTHCNLRTSIDDPDRAVRRNASVKQYSSLTSDSSLSLLTRSWTARSDRNTQIKAHYIIYSFVNLGKYHQIFP